MISVHKKGNNKLKPASKHWILNHFRVSPRLVMKRKKKFQQIATHNKLNLGMSNLNRKQGKGSTLEPYAIQKLESEIKEGSIL